MERRKLRRRALFSSKNLVSPGMETLWVWIWAEPPRTACHSFAFPLSTGHWASQQDFCVKPSGSSTWAQPGKEQGLIDPSQNLVVTSVIPCTQVLSFLWASSGCSGYPETFHHQYGMGGKHLGNVWGWQTSAQTVLIEMQVEETRYQPAANLLGSYNFSSGQRDKVTIVCEWTYHSFTLGPIVFPTLEFHQDAQSYVATFNVFEYTQVLHPIQHIGASGIYFFSLLSEQDGVKWGKIASAICCLSDSHIPGQNLKQSADAQHGSDWNEGWRVLRCGR